MFTIEHIVKFKLSYKNCYGDSSVGEVTFDFNKKSFKFSDVNKSQKGTFNIADMRELVRIFDEEATKYNELKTPEQLAAEKAKKDARLAKRRANAAKKKPKAKKGPSLYLRD